MLRGYQNLSAMTSQARITGVSIMNVNTPTEISDIISNERLASSLRKFEASIPHTPCLTCANPAGVEYRKIVNHNDSDITMHSVAYNCGKCPYLYK